MPRAATSVATSTGALPARKAPSAASRCDCVRSPCMLSALHPPGALPSSLATHAAVRFFCTNTSARSDAAGRPPSASTRSSSLRLLSFGARTNRCVIAATVLPTRPTPTHVYRRRNSAASLWIASGNVALNSSVCLLALGGMSLCCTMRRTCGSNPMSSMRSASSRTRNLVPARLTRPLSTKSTSLPGVATSTSHPDASSLSCGLASAPPYTTEERTGPPKVSLRASRWICAASSRVGARTSAEGAHGEDAPGATGGEAPRAQSSGRRKPAVLPEPVWAQHMRSWCARASGTACAWIGVGLS
mmetsp:Transcript_28034/g.95563  ORF Transcript_28034/g.95563 Transcript_28034/m.95563 type:complete len:302 (+) Transcript_28034:105-1010(+)